MNGLKWLRWLFPDAVLLMLHCRAGFMSSVDMMNKAPLSIRSNVMIHQLTNGKPWRRCAVKELELQLAFWMDLFMFSVDTTEEASSHQFINTIHARIHGLRYKFIINSYLWFDCNEVAHGKIHFFCILRWNSFFRLRTSIVLPVYSTTKIGFILLVILDSKKWMFSLVRWFNWKSFQTQPQVITWLNVERVFLDKFIHERHGIEKIGFYVDGFHLKISSFLYASKCNFW